MKINFTFIIPHYNTPELLVRCIESIPIRDDVQIIVIDDYSDDVHTYLGRYPIFNRKGVEFYQSTSEKGAGSARNEGLKYACGKWLLFADSDDFYTDELNQIMDLYCDSDAELVYFKQESVYSDTLKPADRAIEYNKKLEQAVKSNNLDPFIYTTHSPCSKLISLELVKKNNIEFEAIRVSNDAYFSIKCALLAKKIIVVPEHTMYVVTRREGSLDYSVNSELDEIRLECAYRINKLLYKNGKDKFHRNLFGISGRFVWKWKYVKQYKNPVYMICDLSYVIYGKLYRLLSR